MVDARVAGSGAEANMKKAVSALVGDGKNGQYTSHAQTSAVVMAKYNSLTGTAKSDFRDKAAAIGKDLGLNFGIRDAKGKALNSDVQLTGDLKEANARLYREATGKDKGAAETKAVTPTVTPTAAATPTPTGAATTRDIVDTTDARRRENVTKGVDSIDTSGDGKISQMELRVFAAKQRTPGGDAAYERLDQQVTNYAKTSQAMPKQQVVDFLLNEENKGTKFTNDDVGAARG